MRRLRSVMLAATLALAVLQPLAPARASDITASASGQGRRPGISATQVVVRVESRSALAVLEAEVERTGGRVVRRSFYGEGVLVEVPPGRDSAGYAASIAQRVPVLVAEPLTFVAATALPTDPGYPNQWGLHEIGAPTAWDQTWGSATVTIAVIDSGVDLDHPDLASRIVSGGWDFVGDDAIPEDMHGHGTVVAGIAAAQRNNGVAGVGIAPDCRILPVRVLDMFGQGDSLDVADAIRYATDHGADVINLSLGGPEYSEVTALAVQYALSKDVVVVAASGNSYSQFSTDVLYPARLPGVIAVGSVDSELALAFNSDRGPNLDLVAPGVGIYSTALGGGVATWTGTSMATPFVAGTAALMRSADPDATGTEIAAALTATARDLGAAGRDDAYGYGLVAPADAIRMITPAPFTFITVAPLPNGAGWHRTIPTITLSPDEPAVVRYRWDGGTPATYVGPLVAPEGVHTLSYWSVAGIYTEPTRSATFRVDTNRPTRPVATATQHGSTSVTVSWTPSTDVGSGVKHYEVRRSPSGPAIVISTGTTATITGLVPGTAYTFYVVARDVADNESDASGAATVSTLAAAALSPVFRFYNVTNNTHFYTDSIAEADHVIATWPHVYSFEGTAYYTNPANNTQPLYRFYNRRSGSHFYTASLAEANHVIAAWPDVFTYEGETYRVSPTQVAGSTTVYRFYNKSNGSHFYTASLEEANHVIVTWPHIYQFEGPAFWLGQ